MRRATCLQCRANCVPGSGQSGRFHCCCELGFSRADCVPCSGQRFKPLLMLLQAGL